MIGKKRNITDFDDVTETGVYYSSAGAASHAPDGEGYGILQVISYEGKGSKNQVFFDYKKRIYGRFYNNNTWGNWTPLDNFGCETPAALASLLGAKLKIYHLDFEGTTRTIQGASGDYFGFFIFRNSQHWSTSVIFWAPHNGGPTTIQGGNVTVTEESDGETLTITSPGTDVTYVLYIGL